MSAEQLGDWESTYEKSGNGCSEGHNGRRDKGESGKGLKLLEEHIEVGWVSARGGEGCRTEAGGRLKSCLDFFLLKMSGFYTDTRALPSVGGRSMSDLRKNAMQGF